MRVDAVLEKLLPQTNEPEGRLMEAVRYSTLGGGKRIRPFLTLNTAALFGVDSESAERAAAAIEMVHCYSLIHDDLPAMDDDDLRRGRETSHIKYDEATAILAGDALQALAFEIIASDKTHQDASVRIELVEVLAKAVGSKGMVGGQMLDLVAHNHDFDISEVARLQRMKTGALIDVSCLAGCILGKASDHARQMLHGYAHDLGLAFQIADDLLDYEGDEITVGKKTGKDQAQGKATFVTMMGADGAREQAKALSAQAVEHLAIYEKKADPLRGLANFVVERLS
ncbi:MAG: polyprenyl synthetase family protein [Rhodospirillaceae bacterium]|nr:polyprenyl synthetase family protein [Rhodospirillaceae bacterium]